MLLGVENRKSEDLMIIVETEQDCSDSDNNASETEQRLQETPEPDEFVSCEEGDPVEVEEEGYESDRPMMGRASMRRLKPIPMPANSSASKFPAIQEVNEKRATTVQPSSPSVANMILVTSLINNPVAAPDSDSEEGTHMSPSHTLSPSTSLGSSEPMTRRTEVQSRSR
jgi:hypothetical protein